MEARLALQADFIILNIQVCPEDAFVLE